MMNVTMICSWLGLALAAFQGSVTSSGKLQTSGIEPFQVGSWAAGFDYQGVGAFDPDNPGAWTYVSGTAFPGDTLIVRTDKEGGTSYWVHGQEVPKESVVRDGRVIVLRGSEGERLIELDATSEGRLLVPRGSTLTVEGIRQAPRPALGVRIHSLEPVVLKQLALDEGRGVVITEVIEGQGADKAGLQAYDILLDVAGQPVTVESLPRILAQQSVGQSVPVRIVRGAQEQEVEVEVSEAEPTPQTSFLGIGGGAGSGASGVYTWGRSPFVERFTARSPLVDKSGRTFFGVDPRTAEEPDPTPSQLFGAGSSSGGQGKLRRGGDSGSGQELDELNAELARLRATLEALEQAIERMQKGGD